MNENNSISELSEEQRKRYEPPAIEQSASFERAWFSCAMTEAQLPFECTEGDTFSSM